MSVGQFDNVPINYFLWLLWAHEQQENGWSTEDFLSFLRICFLFQFQGILKIHKNDFKVRPVVRENSGLVYVLSKVVAKLLKNLQTYIPVLLD